MDEYQSLSHTKWECKYHVVFIYRGKPPALPEDSERFDLCGGRERVFDTAVESKMTCPRSDLHKSDEG